MLFTTPLFFIFFLGYFTLHCLVPHRWRLGLIIIGSSLFYAAWNPALLWLPYGLMTIAYWGTCWFEASQSTLMRRYRFILTLVALFLPLLLCKYPNFLFHEVMRLTPSVPTLLPLGISFITFTLAAYVIDVYRGKFPIERDWGMLAGLVLFFPHLIAGPILRPHELIPQFRQTIRPLSAPFYLGVGLFSIGLMKKLIIADPIANLVEDLYAQPHLLSQAEAILAVIGFSVQIYCDFSGYTDMALGLALLLGIELPVNFNRPYGAGSLIAFWHRWHITLSTWLRDYLYIPLGGNRLGVSRQWVNMMITMLLGGLWHGANWTFLIWGGIHGLGLGVNHVWRQAAPRLRLESASLPPSSRPLLKILGVLFTFLCVSIAWVFFRAPDATTAVQLLQALLGGSPGDWQMLASRHSFPILLMAAFFLLHPWDSHEVFRRAMARMPRVVWVACVVFIWASALALNAGSSRKFIYFDF